MNFPDEEWCSIYAKDKDHGAVQVDLPAGRKEHKDLNYNSQKMMFLKGARREPKCKWLNPKVLGAFLHTGDRSN